MKNSMGVDLFKEPAEGETAEEYILKRIRELLADSSIEPGMRLPAERALAEKMRTSRGAVRKALQKLEFYGLVDISPQSGTRIAMLHPHTVERLLESVPLTRDRKMADLLEARFILDIQCGRLAAERRSEADLQLIEQRQEEFMARFYGKGDYLEEDYLFHLAIAQATGNHVLVSLFSQLTPQIVLSDQPHLSRKDEEFSRIPMEHLPIIDAIRNKDPDGVEKAMSAHRDAALKRIFKEH